MNIITLLVAFEKIENGFAVLAGDSFFISSEFINNPNYVVGVVIIKMDDTFIISNKELYYEGKRYILTTVPYGSGIMFKLCEEPVDKDFTNIINDFIRQFDE